MLYPKASEPLLNNQNERREIVHIPRYTAIRITADNLFLLFTAFVLSQLMTVVKVIAREEIAGGYPVEVIDNV